MSIVALAAEQPELLTSPSASPRPGVLHSITDGVPYVDYPGNTHGPLRARISSLVEASRVTTGSTIILVFEDDDPTRPVILASVTDRFQQLPRTDSSAQPRIDTVIDGKRLVFEAEREVVLRCGRGSITLTANGKIVIKGTELVSRSSGANKIKGALVNIN